MLFNNVQLFVLLMLQKKKPREIHEELVATLGDNALSFVTLKNGQLFSRLFERALMMTHEVVAQHVQ